MIEETLKNNWPASLGKLRFSHAEESEPIPHTILHLIQGKSAHKDGGHNLIYMADVYTKTIDTQMVREAIRSISVENISIVIRDMDTDYDEKRKCHIQSVEFSIMSI